MTVEEKTWQLWWTGPTVTTVAEERVIDVGQLAADLVLSATVDAEADQRGGIGVTQHLNVSRCFLELTLGRDVRG